MDVDEIQASSQAAVVLQIWQNRADAFSLLIRCQCRPYEVICEISKSALLIPFRFSTDAVVNDLGQDNPWLLEHALTNIEFLG